MVFKKCHLDGISVMEVKYRILVRLFHFSSKSRVEKKVLELIGWVASNRTLYDFYTLPLSLQLFRMPK